MTEAGSRRRPVDGPWCRTRDAGASGGLTRWPAPPARVEPDCHSGSRADLLDDNESRALLDDSFVAGGCMTGLHHEASWKAANRLVTPERNPELLRAAARLALADDVDLALV